MHIEVRKHSDVVILDLQGRLTAGLGDAILRESLDELLAERFKKILVNLSAVSFMDSAGLGELVAGLRTANRLGAELKLMNVGERVQAALYMAKLLPVFEIYDNEKEALQHFGARPS
jgi:anti-sigma B factor antagonist